MIEIYQYDSLRLGVCIFASLLSFSWIFKIPEFRIKIWYLFLAVFLMIYSGIGGAIEEVNTEYMIYYVIYVFSLNFILHYFYKNKIQEKGNQKSLDYNIDLKVTRWIDVNGGKIIILYLLLLVFDLIYPTFRLNQLISPPTPSLEDLHYKKFIIGNTKDFISQSVYMMQQFVAPFFFLSLYKYRNKYKNLLLLLLSPVYIDLCKRGIVGRGESLIPLLIVFVFLFEKISPLKKKVIIVIATILFPFICYLAVWFSFVRIGGDMGNISISDSVQILLGQEVSYPMHYNDYQGKASPVAILDYILWLLLLPFPGFLKFGYGDPQVNLKFTMLVTGMDPSQMGFSICLPGLVGEGIFVFGPYLLFFHALIFGIITSYLIKYLSKCDSFRFLYLYVALIFTYSICRGGTAAAYSFAFKQFLIFLIFIHYIKRK